MEKITKYLWVVSGVLIVYLSLLGIFRKNARLVSGEELASIGFEGQCRIGDGELQPLSVLENVEISSGETIFLYGHFTQNVEENVQMMFRLNKINMRLWVNGENVFYYGDEEQRMALERSGGNVWVTWISTGINTSDNIQIDITDNYGNSGKDIFWLFLKNMYIGCEHVLFFEIIQTHMGDVMVSLPLCILGFFIVLIVAFYILFQDMRRNIEKANRTSELEKEVIQSRMSVMLSQIRPHFLFNSLNAISGLCLADPIKADEAIVDFSEYLRENIRALECQNPVSFQQELTHTRNYLKVEKMRFGDRIDVDYDIEFVDFTMPTLTLQPIVENAIRHGIGKVKEGGTILIKSERKEREVVVSVIDNGVGFDPQILKEMGDNHGLENVRLRLDYMLGAKLNVESQPNRGTKVRISIPITQEAY